MRDKQKALTPLRIRPTPPLRAIGSLWWRDVRKLSRQRSRIISGLGQPLLYLLALGTGLGSVFQRAGYGAYTTFLSPGIIAMTIMTSAFVGGISVLWDRKFGQMKVLLVAPVSRWAIVAGRSMGAASAAMLQAMLVLLLCIVAAGVRPSLVDTLSIIPLTLVIGSIFANMGIFFGAIIEDFQSIQLIVNFVLMPLFFLSGALFPLDSLAGNSALQHLVALNPAAYCVDGLRIALGQKSHLNLVVDAVAISITLLSSFIIATFALARAKVN